MLDLNARRVSKGVSRIDWALDEIEKGGFDHFMLKEIFEQPQTIQNTMRGRLVVEEGFSKLGGLNLTPRGAASRSTTSSSRRAARAGTRR